VLKRRREEREGCLSILIATCPRCRTETNTGIAADEQTISELGEKLQVLVLCDDCNEYQRMLVKDLRLSAAA
jgi:hypothetical protein